MSHWWSLAVLRKAFERRLAGEHPKDIAASLGKTTRALRNAWSRHGFKIGHNGADLTSSRPDDQTLRELWARRTRGEKTKDMARELQIDPATLNAYWRDMGLSAHALRAREIREQIGFEVYYNAWRLRRDQHLMWREIAEQLQWKGSHRNLQIQTGRWARRMGIAKPSPPELPRSPHKDKVDIENAWRLHDAEGLTWPQIAEHLQVTCHHESLRQRAIKWRRERANG